MSLAKYKQKRDFQTTPEPQAGKNRTASKSAFVVQRHKASRLHYDFRLEMDGVLKSWAVPKGPSMNPGDKRLAMMVEDHPYDYKNFKGVIPSGYGAGIVEIWDKGIYEAVDEKNNSIDARKFKASLSAGNLKFLLRGKKLKGGFALVRLKNSERSNNWLLIKHRDEFAVDREYNSEDETLKTSPINKWLAANPEFSKKGFATSKAFPKKAPIKSKARKK